MKPYSDHQFFADGDVYVRPSTYTNGTPYLDLQACDGYEGECPVKLSPDQARELRDYLTAWLEETS